MEEATAQRIAAALERIAALLEARQEQPQPRTSMNAQVENYVQLLRDHADELKGRMGLREIAFAVGVQINKPQYKAFGMALTAYGATKGISGSRRYYYFRED